MRDAPPVIPEMETFAQAETAKAKQKMIDAGADNPIIPAGNFCLDLFQKINCRCKNTCILPYYGAT